MSNNEQVLGKFYSASKRLYQAEVGVEIETEFKNKPELSNLSSCWNVKTEESLREYGLEFCTKPIKVKTFYKIIDNLIETITTDENGLIRNFERCGIHVHINVLDMTPTQIYTFIFCSWLLDEVLIEWSGNRKHNLFCKTLEDCHQQVFDLESDLNVGRQLTSFSTDSHKYSSINLATIQTLGTLEFRSMETTVDKERIITWVEGLYGVKNNSMKHFQEPKEVIDCAFNDEEDFLDKILEGTELLRSIKNSVHDYKTKINNIIPILYKSAYSNEWKYKPVTKEILRGNQIKTYYLGE